MNVTEIIERKKDMEWVKPVLFFVKENYADRILVADAAAKVDFSQAHFMRLFKQTMGVSFGAFLKEYRLAKAEEMLRTTNESVLDVAQDSGFQNFSYFIRAFKKKYGKTPLKYRECQRR